MTQYTDEIKAAVMAALLEGQSVNKVAADYNIPAGTVKSWKSRQINGESVASVATEKRERIGELLVELLEVEIETLKCVSIAARDPGWLKMQPADGLAVFSGVKYDKLVRVLEAFGKDDNDSNASN